MLPAARFAIRTITLIALIIVSISSARDAHAYCRMTTCDVSQGDKCHTNKAGCVDEGLLLTWKSLPIIYRFHGEGSSKLDNDAAREAVRRGFEAWENVKCGGRRTTLRFEEGSDIEGDVPTQEEAADDESGRVQVIGIYFRDTDWKGGGADNALAFTKHLYSKKTGLIDYADLEINTADVTFSLSANGNDDDGRPTPSIASEASVDLQAVITHEAGHYIGLAHSEDIESIMVPTYCDSQKRCAAGDDIVTRKRKLSPDDEKAVCRLYPPARQANKGLADSSCAMSPSRAVANNNNTAPTPISLLIGVALAVVALLRHRKPAASA